MYTPFDWRVGVLGGQPLFVKRYHMVRDHWHIIKYAVVGAATEGRTEAVALADSPQAVLNTAVAAARLIGDGFYGVDLKQTDACVFVIEINDNLNLDVGAADKVLGDEVYRRRLDFCWPGSKGVVTRQRCRPPPLWLTRPSLTSAGER